MTDRPVLYSFRRCPYAMRARLALLISGTVCIIREVKLSAKPAAMLAASPKGTVPVLLPDKATVIEESRDIMRWALTRSDPDGWLDRDDAGLIAANDCAFKHHLDRYKYPNRHDSDPIAHRAAGLHWLQSLEERLCAQAHLSGARMGLTDAAIFPFVRQFAATDREWFAAQTLPHLHAWLDGHLTSALFARCMVKLTPWREGDAPTAFGAA